MLFDTAEGLDLKVAASWALKFDLTLSKSFMI
jgi:hypothetical protein